MIMVISLVSYIKLEFERRDSGQIISVPLEEKDRKNAHNQFKSPGRESPAIFENNRVLKIATYRLFFIKEIRVQKLVN